MFWILIALVLLIALVVYLTLRIVKLSYKLEMLKYRYEAMLAEKDRELEILKTQYEAKLKESEEKFEKWKREFEESIRKDAVRRSLFTTLGRVGEEIAPLLIFKNYGVEPKDFRHIGTPIDYVVFKGLSEGRVYEILFIEVKTGEHAKLSNREKEVMKAVKEKRVDFKVINLTEELKRLYSDEKDI